MANSTFWYSITLNDSYMASCSEYLADSDSRINYILCTPVGATHTSPFSIVGSLGNQYCFMPDICMYCPSRDWYPANQAGEAAAVPARHFVGSFICTVTNPAV